MRLAGLAGGVLLALLAAGNAPALTLDDLRFWAGSGTNRAAMVVHWIAPEVCNNTQVPNPVAAKSIAWGFRWNGTASGEDMFSAIVAADPRLFAVVSGAGTPGETVPGFGYDLNNNHVLGLRNGTNILAALSLANAPSAFTNGLVTLPAAAADVFQALDPADLYWGGSQGPTWELWHESGGNGGFTNAPDRGTSPYWMPDNPVGPWTGNHGQWQYSADGLANLLLRDGSWIGWSVAAGDFDPLNPDAPGSIAWGLHKRAPAKPEPAAESLSPYAVAVAGSSGPFGPGAYGDPACVVGQPCVWMLNSDPILGTNRFRVNLVAAPYNTDIDGQKSLVTLNRAGASGTYTYGHVTVAFDHPVTDDPANPYGIDFAVFGNSFYVSSGYTSEASDLRTSHLVGSITIEPMLVSVSPDGEDWYTYTNGPFCDTAFPTQGFGWDPALHDATGSGWTMSQADFTKPVNPALNDLLGATDVTLPTYDALKLYAGSGGGTGFDLAESGFDSIQYIRVSAAAGGYHGGEVDAFSDVRPAVLGESLCVAPANTINGTGTLCFQEPGNPAVNAVALTFHEVADIALATVSRFRDEPALAALSGTKLEAVNLHVATAIETNEVAFDADVAINVAPHYTASGADLDVLGWDGTNWTRAPFEFSANTGLVILQGIDASAAFAVIVVTPPQLAMSPAAGGYGFQFTPVAGWAHTLERTTNWVNWDNVTNATPADAQTVTLSDPAPPQPRSFYRLRLNRP
ncbi:MAG TPA: hypothetical protein P5205_01865 [Candidatus Paceibacterota bacterium]|nr:hypothetical protein [Verrucomicrobiota bacterium]HSA09092.1 hypothetical protein [Candidatus Paceibacterota bacterium]